MFISFVLAPIHVIHPHPRSSQSSESQHWTMLQCCYMKYHHSQTTANHRIIKMRNNWMFSEALKRFPDSIKYTNLRVYVYSLLGTTKRNETSPKQRREKSTRWDQPNCTRTDRRRDGQSQQRETKTSLEKYRKAWMEIHPKDSREVPVFCLWWVCCVKGCHTNLKRSTPTVNFPGAF